MAFKLKKGDCKGCNTTNVMIVYSSGKLCHSCNRDRLASKKRQWKKVYKPTGEKELFLQIWSERPHLCVNCNKDLGNEPRTFFFSHILSKGAHPEKRLQKNNIQLLCFQCHQAYDHGTKEQFLKRSFKVQVTSPPATTASPQKDNPPQTA